MLVIIFFIYLKNCLKYEIPKNEFNKAFTLDNSLLNKVDFFIKSFLEMKLAVGMKIEIQTKTWTKKTITFLNRNKFGGENIFLNKANINIRNNFKQKSVYKVKINQLKIKSDFNLLPVYKLKFEFF